MQLTTIRLFMLSIIWMRAQSELQEYVSVLKGKKDLEISAQAQIPIENFNNKSITLQNKNTFYYYKAETAQNRNKASMTLLNSPRILIENIDKSEILNNSTEFDLEKSTKILSDLLVNLQFQPVVILVDDAPKAIYNAIYFTDKFLDKPEINTELWLMKYNVSGVTNIMTQSRSKTDKLRMQLQEEFIQNSKQYPSNGSAVFFAILKASQLLPENSAIILFTEKKSIDEDLAWLTLNNLNQKHITINVVWCNSYPTKENEDKLLKEMTFYTKGHFSIGNNMEIISNNKLNNIINKQFMIAKEELLVKKRIFLDEITLIPIDHSIKSLDIIIEGPINSAIFISPNGYRVDLLDLMSVQRLAPGAQSAHEQGRTHVRFDTTKVTTESQIGVWELRTTVLPSNPDPNGYILTVYAETELAVTSKLLGNVKKDLHQKQLQLEVNGDIFKIENITFVDTTGQEIQNVKNAKIQNNPFSETGNAHSKKQFQISQDNVTLPVESFYIKVTGTNNKGEVFSRLSYVNRNMLSAQLPPLLIEMSTRSELISTAGATPKIVFEVTNNRDQTVLVPFAVQDEKSLLRDLRPRGLIWIGSKQTIEVTAYTYIPPNTQLQFTDVITLTAQGQDRLQKSAMLYIANERFTDTELPYLDYRFTSNCIEISSSSCQSGTWTIEVTAQDAQSGLLKVYSNPIGLYSPNGYISGTKEKITSYYSASCCQPYLEITAIDLNNNRRSYRTDANHANLSIGSIAAIVVGVILFLVILVIIIVLIRKRYKKRQSLDLPRYRGTTTTSRY